MLLIVLWKPTTGEVCLRLFSYFEPSPNIKSVSLESGSWTGWRCLWTCVIAWTVAANAAHCLCLGMALGCQAIGCFLCCGATRGHSPKHGERTAREWGTLPLMTLESCNGTHGVGRRFVWKWGYPVVTAHLIAPISPVNPVRWLRKSYVTHLSPFKRPSLDTLMRPLPLDPSRTRHFTIGPIGPSAGLSPYAS